MVDININDYIIKLRLKQNRKVKERYIKMENVRELKTVFEEFVAGDYVHEVELNIIEEFGVEAIVELIKNIKIENLNDLQKIKNIYDFST